jgi:hypothetical protein
MPESYALLWNERTKTFDKVDARPYVPDTHPMKGEYLDLEPGDRVQDDEHQPDPGEWFTECEMKVQVDHTKILLLPQPWIIVQGYWVLDDHELSIRLIPARELAYFRMKSLDFGCRQKMSYRIPYQIGRHLVYYAQGVAYKYRFIKRDDTTRAWLIDYFPETDWWQAESEFHNPGDKGEPCLKPVDRLPVWSVEDITQQTRGYTRERARSRSFKEHEKFMAEAIEYGSREEYEPGDDDFNWVGDEETRKPV